jgi:MscS family membrane protein
MTKKLYVFLNSLLLIAIIYFNFFNEFTSNLIAKHYRLKAIASFVIFYISIYIISNITKYIYSRRNKLPKGKRNNVHFGIENIASIAISIGFLFMFLRFFGIDPKELVTSLTIVAAAIAILTKEYIVDFLSGIYLSFSNTFEINDYVKIAEEKGKILEINLLKLKLLNDNDDIVIIPNSKVQYSEIINYTQKDAKLISVDFQIGLNKFDNIFKLEKDLIGSLSKYQDLIEKDSYNLVVEKMKSDYIEAKFQYTLNFTDAEKRQEIRRKTKKEIFNFISGISNE